MVIDNSGCETIVLEGMEQIKFKQKLHESAEIVYKGNRSIDDTTRNIAQDGDPATQKQYKNFSPVQSIVQIITERLVQSIDAIEEHQNHEDKNKQTVGTPLQVHDLQDKNLFKGQEFQHMLNEICVGPDDCIESRDSRFVIDKTKDRTSLHAVDIENIDERTRQSQKHLYTQITIPSSTSMPHERGQSDSSSVQNIEEFISVVFPNMPSADVIFNDISNDGATLEETSMMIYVKMKAFVIIIYLITIVALSVTVLLL